MSNLQYTNHPADASTEDVLAQLALDLNWTLSRSADNLWRQLNAELWDRTHNPWAVLQTVSAVHLHSVTSGPQFRMTIERVARNRSAEHEVQRWFGENHPNSPLTFVAYFSMEYMLSEALPIYSGGLGNVAGDQLKAADDLGVPVIGIGLLYSQGNFRQQLDRNGAQQVFYPFNDPGQLPVRPLRRANGDWVRLTIPMPGSDLWIRVWEAQVGRARLFLLDTNDLANVPEYRDITGELYGGGQDVRLRQELVLGVGGWRVLDALDLHPEVCHLNEGHAAFAVLERAASYMTTTGSSFPLAMAVNRAGNLFTTHTPVEAGFDRFPMELMQTHFERYWAGRLGISFEALMALGRSNPHEPREPFNMAYLAIRGSGAINGVSRLHGMVSRNLFQPLFPRWPASEVPVGHVTNGIHVPTWHSDEADFLFQTTCGADCWKGNLEGMTGQLRNMPDSAIWTMRSAARKSMVEYTRQRYARQIAIARWPESEVDAAGRVLNVKALTLGFARRFAPYKRPNLLFHDRARLARIVRNANRPVQLVIAGKAHPQDLAGQEMIRQWNEFIRQFGVFSSVVFLSDYDMQLTQQMVRGVDVWINTPHRPWEASGTSGMKVLANGGLNLSEIDGWWEEAAAPEVGWSLGDGQEHGNDPAWDGAEADALYSLLEEHIIPEFFERDEDDVPVKWVARIRESTARLTPQYSANRAVRQYTEDHYIPRAIAYKERAAQDGQLGSAILAWQNDIDSHWADLVFEPPIVEMRDGQMHFRIAIRLGRLHPEFIRVELFAEARGTEGPVRQVMDRSEPLPDGVFVYSASVEGTRPAADYTPRVIPNHPSGAIPLEATAICWQK